MNGCDQHSSTPWQHKSTLLYYSSDPHTNKKLPYHYQKSYCYCYSNTPLYCHINKVNLYEKGRKTKVGKKEEKKNTKNTKKENANIAIATLVHTVPFEQLVPTVTTTTSFAATPNVASRAYYSTVRTLQLLGSTPAPPDKSLPLYQVRRPTTTHSNHARITNLPE